MRFGSSAKVLQDPLLSALRPGGCAEIGLASELGAAALSEGRGRGVSQRATEAE